jgi:heptosyltransferase I
MSALSFDTPPRSLCILRLSAIGDVTHILPIIATLQEVWPDTKITWIIGRIEYQLVKSLSNIEFIIFDKRNGFGEYLNLRKSLRGRNFDLLFMMQVALRANLISTLIKAPIKIGYDADRSRDFHSLFTNQSIDGPGRVHVLDTFFQFLEKAGIRHREMNWLIRANDEDQEYAQQIMNHRPSVIINPCSSARKNNWRNWSIASYAKVIDYLMALNIQVILTGGPARQEVDYANSIIQKCAKAPVNLVGKTSLTQLLALLEKAQCLIAPDTGPAHIGTIAGIPVIGLFASSNPLRTGPYNSQQFVVNYYPESLKTYNQTTIEKASWGARVRNANVMQGITPEMVIAKLNECLQLST